MKQFIKYSTLLVVILFPSWGFTQLKTSEISFGDMRARSIGPAVMSGRVSTLDGINENPEAIYVGSASGGVWKSLSAGANFQPVFDEHIQSIGHIAIDQNFPDTVWVGTGEPWVRNSVSVGDGIYVTTNGGISWVHKGLLNSERISKILIDPRNSNIIYVAVQGQLWNSSEERGVYKSSDFGDTWDRILYIDENTGCADMDMDPENPDVIYAAMWEHRRSPDFFDSGGESSGLFKSMDGGKSWTQLTNDLPEGKLGRIAIAVAKSNPKILYATIEAEKKEEKGLYKSLDEGESWELINSDFNTTVRPFYFSRLVVDPHDAEIVYKCGYNLIISEDGGHRFRMVGGGVHSDIHSVWINPQNTKNVYIGTDGGAYRSMDRGYTFEHFGNLPLAQFYQVSVDNDDPYHVYGGLQDNGSWYAPSRGRGGGIRNSDWQLSFYGDGFYSMRHPTDKNTIYSEAQGGNLVRHNKIDGQSKNIQPIPSENEPEYRFNWNTPINLSVHNPDRIFVGAQFLFKSDNRGDSWEVISPDLSTNDPQRQRQKQSGGLSIDNSTAENNTTIYAICESPINEKIIWVGTDDGNIQLTADGGENWRNCLSRMPGLPKGLWVSSVDASNINENIAYVTVDGHRSGDMNTYVYKTDDLGQNWSRINDENVNGFAHVIKEDLVNPKLLYLGTEFGLFISLDGGDSWKRFSNNLPKVAVHDLALPTTDDALVIGTHGRGVYILDDLFPLRQLNDEFIESTLEFFKTDPAIIRTQAMAPPFGGSDVFVGENPRDVAAISYYMKKRHTFGKMDIQVFSENGELISELPAGKSKGINIVELPLRLPQPKAAPTNNRMALFGSALTPSLTEGTYTVKIRKGKEEYESVIELKNDPSGGYTKEEREVQMNTLIRLYNLTNQLGHIYFSMEDMHTQAHERSTQADKELINKLNNFSKEAEKYKNSLVSLEGDFYVDEGSNIREEISTLYLNVSFYPGMPSEAQIRKTGILEKRMADVQRKFKEFKDRMEVLNAQLKNAGLKTLSVKSFEDYIKA